MLGAAAAQAAPRTLTPNRRGDHAANGCSRQDCTLREAIGAANAHPGPDRITLRPGRPYGLALGGRGEDLNETGDLDVSGPLTIVASGHRRATIDAGGVDRAIDAFARLTVTRLMITGGLADHDFANVCGAGIRSAGGHALTVVRSVIAGNRELPGGTGVGGGIARSGTGNLVVRHSEIKDNRVGLAGGGVFDGGENSRVLIADSRILDNRTPPPYGYGGGLDEFGDNTEVRIERSVVSGNTAANEGGGIYIALNSLRLISSRVSGNTAGTGGGGILARKDDVLISRSTIAGNRAKGEFVGLSGGGIIHFANGEDSTMRIERSTIAGNRADLNGGGIGNWASEGATATLRLTNTTVAGNSARTIAGGIDNFVPDSGVAKVFLNATTVAYNDADSDNDGTGFGGGLNNGSILGSFSVENSLIARNRAPAKPQCTGIFSSAGHNLTSGQPGGCVGLSQSSDLLAPDPRIGALAANGGPTQTISLRAGSPAIGHGGAGTPKRDQRGVLRDAHPDSGAFERR